MSRLLLGRFKGRSGTTLVEIILYLTIFIIFLSAAMTFTVLIAENSHQSKLRIELESNRRFVAQMFNQTLRRADSIDVDNSVFDDDAGSLMLTMNDPDVNPTVFTLDDGDILFQQGTDPAVSLIGELVTVTALNFHLVSSPKAPDQIQVVAIFTPTHQDLPNTDLVYTLNLTHSLR